MACIGLALALLSAPGANAANLIFQFGNAFSSSGSLSSPTGPAPWLTADIQDVAPGKVDLTISGSGLQGTEFISDFYLNLNPSLNPKNLTFTLLSSTGSFTDPTINLGANKFKADGSGYYDIDLDFAPPHASRFTVGDSVTYQITGSGIDADSFDFTSVMSGGDGTYLAAAHVQSIGSDGSSSAWIGPVALDPVPEPAPGLMLLLSAGLWICGLRLMKRGK